MTITALDMTTELTRLSTVEQSYLLLKRKHETLLPAAAVLCAALEKYAHHTATCGLSYFPYAGECHCGLATALKQIAVVRGLRSAP